MATRTSLALVAVACVAAGMAYCKGRASLDEGPMVLVDGRVVHKPVWQQGRQWLMLEQPCHEEHCARVRGAQRVTRLRERGWADRVSCVLTDEGPWLEVGHHGGMPVVYVAGVGTAVIPPSELEARRKPHVRGGADLCW